MSRPNSVEPRSPKMQLVYGLLVSEIIRQALGNEPVKDPLLAGERDTLAGLPLEKLLHVKKALEAKLARATKNFGAEVDGDVDEYDKDEFSMALRERKKKKKKYKDDEEPQEQQDRHRQRRPSRHQQAPLRRDSWEDESPWKSSKEKGDIQTIFQGTITVLAFLAFGGYLLCLILQTVKGGYGGGDYPPTVSPTTSTTTTTTTAATANSAGRRRRRRRAPEDNPQLTPMDHMIHTLFVVAESYAKYEAMNEAPRMNTKN